MRSALPSRAAALLLAGFVLAGCGVSSGGQSYDSVDKLLEAVELTGIECHTAGRVENAGFTSERSTCQRDLVLSVFPDPRFEGAPDAREWVMREKDRLEEQSGPHIDILIGENWMVSDYRGPVDLEAMSDQLGGEYFRIERPHAGPEPLSYAEEVSRPGD